jgi:hypothetical protein
MISAEAVGSAHFCIPFVKRLFWRCCWSLPPIEFAFRYHPSSSTKEGMNQIAKHFDFVAVKSAIQQLLGKTLKTFTSKQSDVTVTKLGFWAHGFGGVVKVIIHTSDDATVFKDEIEEYVSNEFGGGIQLQWPDMYGPGDENVFAWPGGNERRTNQAKEGNDAIDLPLFDLLVEILQESNFDDVKHQENLELFVEMSNDEQISWRYGQTPPHVALETHLIRGEPMLLTTNSWFWIEIVDGVPEVVNWRPESHEDDKLQRFQRAIAATDWSGEAVRQIQF